MVGDLHGDYASFRSVLNIANPAKDLVVFLGDYADRGISGTEVLEGISRLLDRNRENLCCSKETMKIILKMEKLNSLRKH